jgi:hypothetical protein
MDGCVRVPASLRLAAIASVAGFRDSVGNFALDACIPVRAADVERPGTLEGMTRLVFLHVDGGTSLQDIASRTDLSLEETIAICFDLVARGIVQISSPEEVAS